MIRSNIALYGGEPLLLQNKEIIEYIISKAPNAKYSITTNGYNIIEFIDILSRIDINNITGKRCFLCLAAKNMR